MKNLNTIQIKSLIQIIFSRKSLDLILFSIKHVSSIFY